MSEMVDAYLLTHFPQSQRARTKKGKGGESGTDSFSISPHPRQMQLLIRGNSECIQAVVLRENRQRTE